MTTPAKRLYRTERTLTRTLRVAYPSGRGRMVLRTEQDWDRDVEPVAVSEDGNVSTFALEADQPFLYFKPCLVVHMQDGQNLFFPDEASWDRTGRSTRPATSCAP